MSELEYILLFTFIGSIASLIGGIALLSREKFAVKIAHFLAAFAAGVLLGSAFLDLLPEAAHEAEKTDINIFLFALCGMVFFFFVERSIHWFHHHEKHHEHDNEVKSTLPLIIIGDTIHNFIDGIVIAATFMVSIPLGIVTTLAVAAHEIPQEIGDFGLMLHKGLSRKKVLLVNIVSAAFAFLGAGITYAFGNIFEGYISMLLALTAGLFIYIASSDLIPEIQYEKHRDVAFVKSALLVAGIATVWMSVSFLNH